MIPKFWKGFTSNPKPMCKSSSQCVFTHGAIGRRIKGEWTLQRTNAKIGSNTNANSNIFIEQILKVSVYQCLLSCEDCPNCCSISQLRRTYPTRKQNHNSMP